MTATQVPCAPSSPLERATTPAPSATRSARKRYWEDTVADAVVELRQRLGSTRESVVTLALLTIIEVEKHKMRHGRPVSGTETSHVREDEDPHPLPKLAPLEEPKPKLPASKGIPGVAPTDPGGIIPTTQPPNQPHPVLIELRQASQQVDPPTQGQPATGIPPREPGPLLEPLSPDEPARSPDAQDRPASGRGRRPTTPAPEPVRVDGHGLQLLHSPLP